MRARAAIGSAVIAILLGCLGSPAVAGAAPLIELPENIALGPLPYACTTSPTGTPCENAFVYYLDKARAKIGLGPYDLPADFTTLGPESQLLILANLDRAAYGVAPIVGLAGALNASAAEGVALEKDPALSALLPGFTAIYGYSANWAGGRGISNTVSAYYLWMYDDGVGINGDCTAVGQPGCWGHRRDVFFTSAAGELMMAASIGTSDEGTPGYATLIAAAVFAGAPAYSYTWAQAVADGAGSNAYNPGTLQELTIHTEGSGEGSVSGFPGPSGAACTGTCEKTVGSEPETLTATASAGSVFAGWGGACSGQATCAVTPSANVEVTATFNSKPQTTTTGPPGPTTTTTVTTTTSETPAEEPSEASGEAPAVHVTASHVDRAGGSASFSFSATGAQGFQCALVRLGKHARKPRYTTCRSPQSYKGLKAGRYKFFVRSTGAEEEHSAPLSQAFKIS